MASTSTIHEDIFLRPFVPRPSHLSKLDGLEGQAVLQRFTDEKLVLEQQLKECEAFYQSLLGIRRRNRLKDPPALTQNTLLADGFFLKTEITDTETFLVSLGLQDAYIELELEEAIAYCQRREQFLRVNIEKVKDRLAGLQAELKMDYNQISELLQHIRSQPA